MRLGRPGDLAGPCYVKVERSIIMYIKNKTKRLTSFTYKFFILFISLSLFTNCATNPKNITPQHISKHRYAGYSCSHLAGEKEDLEMELVTLTASMEKKSLKDSGLFVLGLLFILPLFFMYTKNSVENFRLAQLKGKFKGVKRALAICEREKRNIKNQSSPIIPIIINNKN